MVGDLGFGDWDGAGVVVAATDFLSIWNFLVAAIRALVFSKSGGFHQ